MTSGHQPLLCNDAACSIHTPVNKINNAFGGSCHGFLFPSPLTLSLGGHPCWKSQRSIPCRSWLSSVSVSSAQRDFGALLEAHGDPLSIVSRAFLPFGD